MDFRGHGESAHAPGTYLLDRYVADTLALCGQASVETAVVVGHSLGGVVALAMAQIHPDLVLGLLLEDPPLYRHDESSHASFFSLLREFTVGMQARGAPVEEYERSLAAVPSRAGRGSMADVLGADGTRARAEGLARLDPDVFLPAIEGTGLSGSRPEVPVSCPVLVLRADPSFEPAFSAHDEGRFRENNPHATVRMVPGSSHLLHEEHPEAFLSELQSFLDDSC